jgi:acetolactate synthase-1/2/3 large subunit|tara:strand:+ start:783 stop:2354 length:1572 start_codon:yes stop_codon:yes gene_type:complete
MLFGLPGGEILNFVEAAKRVEIDFLLTRHEATASLMADATGQMLRRPGVCVSTLGPGAVNMTLGVANAYLDRSPLLAITASTATSAAPYATHQNLDLSAVYRPFTKAVLTLDGQDTEAKVRRAFRTAMTPRMGPVHIALPSDVACAEDRQTVDPSGEAFEPPPIPPPSSEAIAKMSSRLRTSKRPILILGLDLGVSDVAAVRRFVEALNVPVFVTPKAKGMLAEDHPNFFGVCAGVSGDGAIVDFLASADLLVGVGFEPVESEKLWHQTMPIVSIGPLSIASGSFRPEMELEGQVATSLTALSQAELGPFAWDPTELVAFRQRLASVVAPAKTTGRGLSPSAVVHRLREVLPRETIATTDVGSVKFVTSQGWTTYEPMTFFESNGLSAMSYAFPAAMAASLIFRDRPVLCTIGDGGFGMTMADVETCVRLRLPIVTVVFNDCSLSLIQMAQARRGLADVGVRYGKINFGMAAEALGAWGRRVASLDELGAAVAEGRGTGRPVVIDVPVDPAEYRMHSAPPTVT